MEQIKKILIVEDDGLLLNVLSDKFKSFNFQILKAQDGKQAVDLILKERPALVLLDLMVPKMDGF
ncbi:MAG: response regulator, partial [Candidatus Doudnabacteria bacterium]|nr:response regulator [Candidatus Doudnabacteria bacterium]